MAEPVDANTAVSIDADGRVHVAATKAIEEPESLIELRKRVTAMMPRVDISEAILEVLGWCPQFLESLTPTSGGWAHLANLDISVAAYPTAQALNITYAPIAVPGVPALARHRLGYVKHTFLRTENYAAGQPAPSHRPGRHRFRAGIGWWAGRGHRRNAICCPGAVRPCPTE